MSNPFRKGQQVVCIVEHWQQTTIKGNPSLLLNPPKKGERFTVDAVLDECLLFACYVIEDTAYWWHHSGFAAAEPEEKTLFTVPQITT